MQAGVRPDPVARLSPATGFLAFRSLRETLVTWRTEDGGELGGPPASATSARAAARPRETCRRSKAGREERVVRTPCASGTRRAVHRTVASRQVARREGAREDSARDALPRGSLERGQQVHRRDREEPAPGLRRGRERRCDPAVRGSRRALRQAKRDPRLARPLRERRGRVPRAVPEAATCAAQEALSVRSLRATPTTASAGDESSCRPRYAARRDRRRACAAPDRSGC